MPKMIKQLIAGLFLIWTFVAVIIVLPKIVTVLAGELPALVQIAVLVTVIVWGVAAYSKGWGLTWEACKAIIKGMRDSIRGRQFRCVRCGGKLSGDDIAAGKCYDCVVIDNETEAEAEAVKIAEVWGKQ